VIFVEKNRNKKKISFYFSKFFTKKKRTGVAILENVICLMFVVLIDF
jgi:hypothetical protein